MDDRTTPRSRGQAQIILALSPADGLVAIPVGEQYRWANTALQPTPGFERRPDGTYALRNVDTAAPILRALADTARRHRVLLFGGPRTYLGDYATALADGLPGTWTVKIDVYAHPPPPVADRRTGPAAPGSRRPPRRPCDGPARASHCRRSRALHPRASAAQPRPPSPGRRRAADDLP